MMSKNLVLVYHDPPSKNEKLGYFSQTDKRIMILYTLLNIYCTATKSSFMKKYSYNELHSLLKKGISPNTIDPNTGTLPLTYVLSFEGNNQPLCELLIRYGAQQTMKDRLCNSYTNLLRFV